MKAHADVTPKNVNAPLWYYRDRIANKQVTELSICLPNGLPKICGHCTCLLAQNGPFSKYDMRKLLDLNRVDLQTEGSSANYFVLIFRYRFSLKQKIRNQTLAYSEA